MRGIEVLDMVTTELGSEVWLGRPVGTFAGVQISLVQSMYIWCSRNLHSFRRKFLGTLPYIVDIRARATGFIWLVRKPATIAL